MEKHVVIVGGGFAGLNAAKKLGNRKGIRVTLIDRNNHHLFQPLLYQVATAGLSPADIAVPIRSILSPYKNVRVLQGDVIGVDFERNAVQTSFATLEYQYLILACGAQHSYFGNDAWEPNAPGLKTIENATDIRRRILTAFEIAERTDDHDERRRQMTFVIVGGGPTGVELAGAIGEMSRFTLARDFRSIDAKSTRVFLMEGGPRILSGFPPELASRAARDLEQLGVQIWTSSLVSQVDNGGVSVGTERIEAATVIWAAGVKAARLSDQLNLERDEAGRILVGPDLSIPGHSNAFVAGDQARVGDPSGNALPGVAPVAVQQGRYLARLIRKETTPDVESRPAFSYVDKGMMATIGRNKAIAKTGRWEFTGRFAWLLWLVVHVYFLTGFRNRLFVVISWAWSYLTYRRGARLIVGGGNLKADSEQTSQRTDVAI